MRNTIRNTFLGLTAAASVTALAGGTANAFPAAPLGAIASPVEQVRLVCDDWGRCWRTGPRYYRYGYYGGPRRYYGHRYGYYGYGGPGVRFGGPGFAFRFGL